MGASGGTGASGGGGGEEGGSLGALGGGEGGMDLPGGGGGTCVHPGHCSQQRRTWRHCTRRQGPWLFPCHEARPRAFARGLASHSQPSAWRGQLLKREGAAAAAGCAQPPSQVQASQPALATDPPAGGRVGLGRRRGSGRGWEWPAKGGGRAWLPGRLLQCALLATCAACAALHCGPLCNRPPSTHSLRWHACTQGGQAGRHGPHLGGGGGRGEGGGGGGRGGRGEGGEGGGGGIALRGDNHTCGLASGCSASCSRCTAGLQTRTGY
jgi:hypothetical protein